MYSEKEIRGLEKELFDLVKKNTPEAIQKKPFIDLNNKKRFEFLLTKKHIVEFDLWGWFKNYKREAMVSTGGIRGPQNILFPWDTRFPINYMGIILATLGKAQVLKDKFGKRQIEKIAGCEVRYNSKDYLELISRIQAGQEIITHVPKRRETIPIWMASFLVFKYDLAGGEYVTSSHAVSTKTATKDLNSQGSQFLSEEAAMFVGKIEKILKSAEEKPYPIVIEAADSPLIEDKFMSSINEGINPYLEYLRLGVATKLNLMAIRNLKRRIIIDTVGGCMYRTQLKIFEGLGIADSFEWLHIDEDPFFHGIGKYHKNPRTGREEYFDMSCDVTILDVAKTLGYEKLLVEKPIGTVVEITDPDGDRLSIGQIEPKERIKKIEELGIDCIEIGKEKVLTLYTPNQSYLMIMDYHMKQLKESGTYNNHPRFIIKTTASAMAWDEWAAANRIPVVNLPVGFKEIASMMKKVEKQILEKPEGVVVVHDIFDNMINLGVQPRLLFAGEESGGMITGPDELIESKSGRRAIAMREKSAGEAIILASAMAASSEKRGILLSEYLEEIFKEDKIKGKYDIRVENIFYNESNPDPISMKKEKEEGEKLRDKNDRFFVGIALARREKKITAAQAKQIFKEAFPKSNFDNFEDVYFVGDGTYLQFSDKYVEIRKSGTDAKTKGYGVGSSKKDCTEFARLFAYYSGELTPNYRKLIGEDYLNDVQKRGKEIYLSYLRDGAPKE